MDLPKTFLEKMRALLGEKAYMAYLASFEEPPCHGLRVNGLKAGAKEAVLQTFSLEEVPWCADGYYYEEGARPAKHPYYHGGLYYLQEPSAMSPGAFLPIEAGDRVLDICAAPGGKSTQLGSRLGGTGVLVANDISAGRAKALVKNVELFGIPNAVVMSETPEKLVTRFPGYFDKILIDAPCSGEGMFRREGDMVKSWNAELMAFCKGEQEKILAACADMLRPGGQLLYSTCTFDPAENEGSIAAFLQAHPDFSVISLPKENGFAPGRGDLVGLPELSGAARLYPHCLRGEGHFLALLQKKGEKTALPVMPPKSAKGEAVEAFLSFAKDLFPEVQWKGIFQQYGEGLYLLPDDLPDLKGLRVLRSGLFLGEYQKGRFTPSQALAMAAEPEKCTNPANFSLADERVIRYLKGETVEAEGKDGWTLVAVDGFPLGWAKRQKGRLKNHYAKGWRWN